MTDHAPKPMLASKTAWAGGLATLAGLAGLNFDPAQFELIVTTVQRLAPGFEAWHVYPLALLIYGAISIILRRVTREPVQFVPDPKSSLGGMRSVLAFALIAPVLLSVSGCAGQLGRALENRTADQNPQNYAGQVWQQFCLPWVFNGEVEYEVVGDTATLDAATLVTGQDAIESEACMEWRSGQNFDSVQSEMTIDADGNARAAWSAATADGTEAIRARAEVDRQRSVDDKETAGELTRGISQGIIEGLKVMGGGGP